MQPASPPARTGLPDRLRATPGRDRPAAGSSRRGHRDEFHPAPPSNSRRKDTVELVEAYAAAGIAEYWIADALGAEPQLQILTRGASRQYARIPADAEGWTQSPLWGARFRLVRVIARAGWVDYRLDHVVP